MHIEKLYLWKNYDLFLWKDPCRLIYFDKTSLILHNSLEASKFLLLASAEV